jgi:hypothetical protein
MAVNGGLAIKGIQADIKAANADGLKFAAGVNVLKSDLHGLEQTAAHNVLGAFQQATTRLHADLPAVNADLAQSSRVLGDIAGHLLGAAVSGEHTFAPLLLTIEKQVDSVAAKFESWASGPGGAKFAQALADDFQHVAPLVEDVAGAIAHLVAAANGPGIGIIEGLDTLAKVLDSIPVPVLSALTTGIVSLRVASLVSGLMDRLAVSITGVAVAEGRAAAGAAGFRGGLASTVGFLGRAAAGWLAVSVAAGAAAHATEGWQSSSNDLTRFAGTFTATLSDVSHLNFKGAWSDLFGSNADKAAKAAGYVKALHSSLDDMWRSLDQHQDATIFNPKSVVLPGHGSVAGVAGGQQQGLTVQEQIQRSYQRTVDKTTDSLNRQREALSTLAGHTTVSQLQMAFGSTATAIQKNIDATQKFLDLGGEQVNTYKGVSIGANTYQAALKLTGGNLEAATGFIEAQIDSLGTQKTALRTTAAEQQRLGTFVSDLSSKYKLTAGQVDVYSEVLGINNDLVASSAGYMRDAEGQFGAFIGVLQNGNTALNEWLAAVDQWSKSADTAADRATLIGAALKAANGDTLSYANTMVQAAQANQQMVTDFINLKKGVLDLKTGTIDYHNAAAAPLLNDLQNMQTAAMNAAAATYQHEHALGRASAADDAFSVYVNDTRGALIKQADQLGITKGQARKLADEYFGIKNSGDLRKQIQLIGQDKVLTALQGILEDLDILAGKHVTSYVDIVTQNVGKGYRPGTAPIAQATGGPIAGPGSGTSDSIPAWLSNGEYVINAKQTAKHRSLLHAINSGAQGFASGGETGGFSGVDYSGSADKNGKSKSSSSSSSAAKKPPSFDMSAWKSFLQAIGITTNAFTEAKNQLVGALRDAKVSARQTAAVARVADRLIAYSQKVSTETDRITKAQNYLSGLREQSRQESSSVRDSVMGLFDLSNAGVQAAPQQVYKDVPVGPAPGVTAASFLTSLTDSADRAGKTRGELKTLENSAKGNPALTALVKQLAENPASAQAQIDALSGASKGDLQNIGKQFGRLQGSARGAGSDVSSLLFGGKINTAEALLNGFDPKKNPALAKAVDSLSTSLFGAGKETARGLAKGLISERKTLVHAMHSVAHDLEETIRHDLHMRSPSRKFHTHGQNVVAGLVNGIIASLPQARSAASQLAASLEMAGAGGRGHARGGDTWHLHGLQDPAAILMAMSRRQAHRGRV